MDPLPHTRARHATWQVLVSRERAAALRHWRVVTLAAHALASISSGAMRHGRGAARRRGFAALRLAARVASTGRVLAAHTASGRVRLAQIATAHAYSRLRQHAAARRHESHRLLVSSQRGVSRRAAALLQPLRALWVLATSRALQRWRAAVVVAALDERMGALQAVLEAEKASKQRELEAIERDHEDAHNEMWQQRTPSFRQCSPHRSLVEQEHHYQRQQRQHPRPPPPPPPSAAGSALPPSRHGVTAPPAPFYDEPPAPLYGERSALDKLFAVLEIWVASRLRPALWAWRQAAAHAPPLFAPPLAPLRVATSSSGRPSMEWDAPAIGMLGGLSRHARRAPYDA